MSAAKKVCIIGSGNWGSAIAKIIGNNVVTMPDKFVKEVRMWVFEETVNDRKLTEIINNDHENVKYLPGIKLPENVVAIPEVADAGEDADIFIFVLPHQFVRKVCQGLKSVKPGAIAVTLIKGFDVKEGGGILLISDVIRELLNIPCAVLMGANIANEVAKENYCEATVGCKDTKNMGPLLKDMFQADYFRIVVVPDETTVEVCGALKNIVAVGAGISDGLGYGDNTKAAVIRLGLMEMIKFCEIFYPGSNESTFLESCGVADLVTTCYGGRNRKVAEAFAKTGKSIEELEQEMLNGQKLQGPPTAFEVNYMLSNKDMEGRFPLFTAIHKICKNELPVAKFIDCLKNHPEHM